MLIYTLDGTSTKLFIADDGTTFVIDAHDANAVFKQLGCKVNPHFLTMFFSAIQDASDLDCSDADNAKARTFYALLSNNKGKSTLFSVMMLQGKKAIYEIVESSGKQGINYKTDVFVRNEWPTTKDVLSDLEDLFGEGDKISTTSPRSFRYLGI